MSRKQLDHVNGKLDTST